MKKLRAKKKKIKTRTKSQACYKATMHKQCVPELTHKRTEIQTIKNPNKLQFIDFTQTAHKIQQNSQAFVYVP